MLVSDIMNSHVVTISPEESVSLAARLISRHNVGSLPVCSADMRLRGMITDRDIVIRCVAPQKDPGTTRIKDVMSRNIIAVSPGDDTSRVSSLMAKGQVRRLPVTEDGRLVGIVSLGDLASRPACDAEASKALSEISLGISRK